jgi:hypothetical protein
MCWLGNLPSVIFKGPAFPSVHSLLNIFRLLCPQHLPIVSWAPFAYLSLCGQMSSCHTQENTKILKCFGAKTQHNVVRRAKRASRTSCQTFTVHVLHTTARVRREQTYHSTAGSVITHWHIGALAFHPFLILVESRRVIVELFSRLTEPRTPGLGSTWQKMALSCHDRNVLSPSTWNAQTPPSQLTAHCFPYHRTENSVGRLRNPSSTASDSSIKLYCGLKFVQCLLLLLLLKE